MMGSSPVAAAAGGINRQRRPLKLRFVAPPENAPVDPRPRQVPEARALVQANNSVTSGEA